jgi:hypothetical protein
MKHTKHTTAPIMPRLTDPRFEYTKAADTDIKATWAKHGWVPPSQQRRVPQPRR